MPGRRARFLASFAVLGPGIVSGFADNDAGGITTYSLAGAKFGYDLLWVTQIALFVTQEIGARIGLATGQGLTGLIRERFGVRWAAFAALTMIGANLGSTVSEFAGISAALSLSSAVSNSGRRCLRWLFHDAAWSSGSDSYRPRIHVSQSFSATQSSGCPSGSSGSSETQLTRRVA